MRTEELWAKHFEETKDTSDGYCRISEEMIDDAYRNHTRIEHE